MKLFTLVCWLLGLLSAPITAGAEDGGQRQEARAAVAAFAAALKSELSAALQADGTLAAIELCNERAPAIATTQALARGATLSRVSLKYRNPANAPTAWQKAVLQEFDSRKANGEEAATLEWDGVAETASGAEYRYMKGIPTAGLCLQCHGEAITPEVAAKLVELYPDDHATGFRVGDLRGAFVVTKVIEP